MDLDETWQVGFRPEKTKPLHVSSEIALWVSERVRKMGVSLAEALFFVTCTTHHFCHFPWIDFRQTFQNTCPGGGSRHVVSYSRKVSIKG